MGAEGLWCLLTWPQALATSYPQICNTVPPPRPHPLGRANLALTSDNSPGYKCPNPCLGTAPCKEPLPR